MAEISATQWHELSPLLDELLEADGETRAQRLAQIRREHAALAIQLETLLSQHTSLERDAFLEGAAFAIAQEPSLVGQTVGAYTLREQIGHGGMGSVWRAERSDGRYQATVALKFLNLALLGRGGAERFAREGNMLARLSHPNIARLLDAGVAAGSQPYLVLEYIAGAPIDAWCDERSLGIEARLRLFLDVLAAVAHAHSNLILHRDLKPSNILINPQGQVKLLDFGIGKLIENQASTSSPGELTQLAGRAFTPDFAAPEQITQGDVTTATDVYALGVLLYLLLTGRHPTAQPTHTPVERLRAVVEAEPPRPSEAIGRATNADLADAASARGTSSSKLVRTLRGDLDNIVAKALRKPVSERYQTVGAFADDLRRHLDHEPIGARPETMAYRIGKFVRRHRAGVLIGSVTVLGLVLTTAFAHWQMIEARHQRDEAVFQSKHANASNEFMRSLLQDFGRSMSTTSMREQLDRAYALLKTKTFEHPIIKASLLRQLAGRYGEMGEAGTHLNLMQDMDAIVQQTDDTIAKAESACSLANAFHEVGDIGMAQQHIDVAKAHLAREDDLLARVECLHYESYIASERGAYAMALAAANESVTALDKAGMTAIQTYRVSLNARARANANAGNTREALMQVRELMRAREAAGGQNSIGYHKLAMAEASYLVAVGKPLEAFAASEQVLEQSKRLAPGGQPSYPALLNHGVIALAMGKIDEAVARLTEAARDAASKQAGSVQRRATLALIAAQVAAGHLDAAGLELEGARAGMERAFTDRSPDGAVALYVEARWLLATGDAAAARAKLDAATRYVEATSNPRHPQARPIAVANAEWALATQQNDAALRHALRALELASAEAIDPKSSAWIGEALVLRARGEVALGQPEAARANAREALVHLNENFGPEHSLSIQARVLAGGS